MSHTADKRKAQILRPSEMPAHARGGGARTIPLVTRAIGSASFINGITEFEPGAAIPFHSHNCEESVMLLEGEAIAEIDGVDHPLQAGDVSFIPPGVPHRFRNLSDSKGMKILWTYATVDATRTLVETGETRPIDAEHHTPAA
jgi:quercetin dioxygenase-like cupin family protein